MSRTFLSMTPAIHDYLLSMSLREHPVLERLRQETAFMPAAQMQIAPEQGQFIQMLLRLMGAKKTLEIGTFTGYSALCAALVLPAEGKIVACDINKDWTSLARRYWQEAGVIEKIDLRIAPALETLQSLIDAGDSNTFDFAFIDADKANYLNYYELALQLVRVGGLIVVDNVLWGGDVADSTIQDKQTKSIRELNERIFMDNRVELSVVPIGDGLTLAWKK